MKNFLQKLSLAQQLTILVGFITINLVGSVSLAYLLINKTQIGGFDYRGIEQKFDFVAKLARARLNINFLSSQLKSQIIDYDEDEIASIGRLMARLFELTETLQTGLVNGGQDTTISCSACHDQEITAMVKSNAENAAEANLLTQQGSETGATANMEMQKMLKSMQDIKNDSDKLATIIHEIEGVAFQTNLLTLNAAVKPAQDSPWWPKRYATWPNAPPSRPATQMNSLKAPACMLIRA